MTIAKNLKDKAVELTSGTGINHVVCWCDLADAEVVCRYDEVDFDLRKVVWSKDFSVLAAKNISSDRAAWMASVKPDYQHELGYQISQAEATIDKLSTPHDVSVFCRFATRARHYMVGHALPTSEGK